jgi:ADP-ribose pyrophosphatase
MPSDFELKSEDTIYRGFLHCVKTTFRFKKFDGSWSNWVTREVSKRHKAACVLLHDPILKQFVLIEEFRVGCLSRTIEIVAGILDTDESPEEVARRESMEEAGLSVLELTPICCYYPSAGGSTEKLHVFLGRVDASNAGGVFGLAHEDEDIQARVVSEAEAYDQLQAGHIESGPAVVALQWFFLRQR